MQQILPDIRYFRLWLIICVWLLQDLCYFEAVRNLYNDTLLYLHPLREGFLDYFFLREVCPLLRD